MRPGSDSAQYPNDLLDFSLFLLDLASNDFYPHDTVWALPVLSVYILLLTHLLHLSAPSISWPSHFPFFLRVPRERLSCDVLC